VLPFLDMTDTMNEEPFADGMTDELIDKLSQSKGLMVASPNSSFYFKGKQVTDAQVGKALNVAYVLDGSVRKSGNTLRVSARLIRADDGFVVWSQTYDRTWADKLMIQDDIASEVSKALKASIN
jgi:transcriptional activator of cad operon